MSSNNTSEEIQEPIRLFFDAINSRQVEQIGMCLHPLALLDNGQERVRGLGAVTAWFQSHFIETNSVLEIIDFSSVEDEQYIVNARRLGSFSDSGEVEKIEETFLFLLSDAKIAALVIRFAGGSDSIGGMMQDLTMAELQRTEEEIENIYRTEHEKLSSWMVEMTGFGLENEIARCREHLEKAHTSASEFKSVATDFAAYLSQGLGVGVRAAWAKIVAQSREGIPKADQLLVGEELMRQRQEIDDKNTARLFDELERTHFQDLPATVEKLMLALPEEDRFSFKVNAATVAAYLKTFFSFIQITRLKVDLGLIWRSFLYAYVIERYGDKLRRGEQSDALSELIAHAAAKVLPGGEAAEEVYEALKKLVVVQNRKRYQPSLFTELKETQAYLSIYASLLKTLGKMLSAYAESVNTATSRFY